MSYQQLVQSFPLVPIRNQSHLDRALAWAERLLKSRLNKGAAEYLEVLTRLIEDYEETAFPIPIASEAEVLRELMTANGLTQTDLESRVGIAQPTISAVLNGVRELTKEQILDLAKFFNVHPAVFLPVR